MMTTQDIMKLALELAGLDEIPEDSGILVEGRNIKKVGFGVDIEAAEILIARELGLDLVISHHPTGGSPSINLYQVMKNQISRMTDAGVPINKAQKAIKEQIDKIERRTHVSNYDRAVSAAKLLRMPFMNIHTPADIISEKAVQGHLNEALKDKPKAKVKDVLDALNELGEYKNTVAKPAVRVGSQDDYAGRVFVTMAGGTGGGENVAKAYFEAGVGTLVVMHMPEDVIKAVKEQNIGNVVVAGHMASDSVGINRLISAMESRGLAVYRMSGVVEPQFN